MNIVEGITQESPIIFSSQSVVSLPCLVNSRRNHPSLTINLESGTHTKLATLLGSTNGWFLLWHHYWSVGYIKKQAQECIRWAKTVKINYAVIPSKANLPHRGGLSRKDMCRSHRKFGKDLWICSLGNCKHKNGPRQYIYLNDILRAKQKVIHWTPKKNLWLVGDMLHHPQENGHHNRCIRLNIGSDPWAENQM